ncbi:DnaJ domain-containing protein [Altererythrobacter confluentis]|uniref:DnaJ domain-containing protein n=1 Tax=Allopontixanthobacter confluentis TaxID=1849021 RepID=A0A6L7GGN5_9SPHN|nr:DnaJ domain-containing protein [Allopontixanthobacter confluentis]MXP14760.1 DnaJ domain-containing protein [Allopontixanthobacter confluentis]
MSEIEISSPFRLPDRAAPRLTARRQSASRPVSIAARSERQGATVNNSHEFVDYYKKLGVAPSSSFRELESAWHLLAKKFHPDNPLTADFESFSEIIEAYHVLRDPGRRDAYDRQHFPDTRKPPIDTHTDLFGLVDNKTAIADAEMKDRILLTLYKRRREMASDPGILQWLLQETLACPEEQFEFHIWYLKSKGFIEIMESSALAITIQGVDEVISTSRAEQTRTFLLASNEGPAD